MEFRTNETPAGPPGEGQTLSIKAQSAFGPRFDLVFSGTAKSHNRGWKRGEACRKGHVETLRSWRLLAYASDSFEVWGRVVFP